MHSQFLTCYIACITKIYIACIKKMFDNKSYKNA